MKRLVTMLFTVLLLMTEFTSCAPKTLLSPTEPVTLTLWHVYGEQSDSPINLLIEEFNSTLGQEKGIVISVTNVTSTSKIASQLLNAQANKPGAPEMPDLFSCHTNTAVLLGSENLVDWNEYFSKDELSNFVPEFLQDGTMEDRLAVFPVSKSTYALFINGSQFDRFSKDTGITYDMLSTWDGFFSAAEKYYEWSSGTTFCAFDYLIRHVELDMLATDGDFTYTEEGWYDTASQTLQNSWLQFAQPLAQGHIAVADLYANTQVMTGESLAGIGSTAAIAYYNDTVTYPDNTSEPMNLQILPLPSSGTGNEYIPQTGVGLASYKTTEQKAEAASVFLRWFTDGERNLNFVATTGYMPVHKQAFESISSYEFSDSEYQRLYEAIFTMYTNCTPVVRPDFDGFYDKVDVLYDSLREKQPTFSQRLENGEPLDDLLKELWELFCSI